MFTPVITYMRHSCTENHTHSAHPQPISKFHFMVKQNHVYVRTVNDGSQTSFGHNSNLLPEQVFNIEFPYLLIPIVSEIQIHAMLTQMEIPPDSVERMKRRISHYAFEAASFCRERGDVCEALDIFIGLKEEDPSSSSSSSTETCMICMDEYVRGVNVARLPCSHLFHGECIVKWLEIKNSCPLCRSVLPSGA